LLNQRNFAGYESATRRKRWETASYDPPHGGFCRYTLAGRGAHKVETSRLPDFLDYRLTDGGEAINLQRRPRFTSRKILSTHCWARNMRFAPTYTFDFVTRSGGLESGNSTGTDVMTQESCNNSSLTVALCLSGPLLVILHNTDV
jgi:hypothetical protein